MPFDICARCDHPLKRHCPGEQSHEDHKESARMIPMEYRKGQHTCHTRHCLNPLCSCVDFVTEWPPLVPETPGQREEWLDAVARDEQPWNAA